MQRERDLANQLLSSIKAEFEAPHDESDMESNSNQSERIKRLEEENEQLREINQELMTPFFILYPILYHTFVNMVIFRLGKSYSLRSPGNQDYQKIIFASKVVFLLKLVVIINES